MISHMALRQFPFVRCSGSFLCMQADRLCTGHYAQYRPSAFSKQPISDRGSPSRHRQMDRGRRTYATSSNMASVQSMTVVELAEKLTVDTIEAGESENTQYIDVREPYEHDIASVPGFRLLPLSRFQEWGPAVHKELDPAKKTIVLCHHGVRSDQAAHFFLSQGFQAVYNVSGGIDAYSILVDPNVPRY